MESAPPPDFLDVPFLLENSEPRPRIPWNWYILGAFVLLVMVGSFAGAQSGVAQRAVQVMSFLLLLLFLAGLPALKYFTIRAMLQEQQQVEGVGELVQLRRWPQAALLLQNYLSRPARNGRLRCQGLVYLGLLLARYHRFDEAASVNSYLIDNDLVDPATAYGLRMGRTMAMLQEDHLFDADRAISELRRLSGGIESAGLALIEIYRDVKTGHPADAIAIFDERLPILREQLGHRSADAHALIARAYDLLGRETEAAAALNRATLLAPWPELLRRYPELQKLSGRYHPAPAPREAL